MKKGFVVFSYSTKFIYIEILHTAFHIMSFFVYLIDFALQFCTVVAINPVKKRAHTEHIIVHIRH